VYKNLRTFGIHERIIYVFYFQAF